MGGRDLTVASICDAVESVLGAVTGIVRSESYDELTEGIPEVPLLQVWPGSGVPVSTGSGTQKLTLGQSTDFTVDETITINADVYARQRSHIGEDMSALVTCLDNIRAKLKEQDCPPFGLTGLQSFQWSWEVGTVEFGGTAYLRVRFPLVFRVY